MLCPCCGIPPVVGTLGATVCALVLAARALRVRWARVILGLVASIVSLLAVSLLILHNHEGLRSRIYASVFIAPLLKDTTLDGVRCDRLGLAGLAGDVVEFGPGPGTNFRCYRELRRWLGVEPNPHFDQIRRAAGENLTFPLETVFPLEATAAFDAAVATHVLCTVDDPAALLRDAVDALRPQGRLYVMEHVAAPPGTPTRLAQLFFAPFFYIFGNGCKFQDPEPFLRATPLHFEVLDRFRVPDLPVPMLRPHLIAVGVKLPSS